jgi:pectinesterase
MKKKILAGASLAVLLSACSTMNADKPAVQKVESKAASKVEKAVAVSAEAMRPQLSAADAAKHTMANYFAKGGDIEELVNDPWDPVKNGIGDVKMLKPTFTVAADGSGTHKTVQAAMDAAREKGGKDRIYVLVKPGTYREQVCLKNAPPVTIYGMEADASRVVIVNNKANGTKKEKGVVLNDCEGRESATSYGTSGSSTFLAYSDAFQAKNLTVANDYDESISPKGTQAVALNTRGDKVILDNVRLLANQDTLMMKSPNTGAISRAYVTNSYIEGDVDYVFSRAIAVFDKVEFKSLGARSQTGYVFAPSHPQNYPYGFLVINSKFTSDGKASNLSLGRAWDDSSGIYTDKAGKVWLPNGMLVIRDSEIGKHIDANAPWGKAASTNRPYSSVAEQVVKFGKSKADTTFPLNRLFEYNNK